MTFVSHQNQIVDQIEMFLMEFSLEIESLLLLDWPSHSYSFSLSLALLIYLMM
jgi:hypothetical protein